MNKWISIFSKEKKLHSLFNLDGINYIEYITTEESFSIIFIAIDETQIWANFLSEFGQKEIYEQIIYFIEDDSRHHQAIYETWKE